MSCEFSGEEAQRKLILGSPIPPFVKVNFDASGRENRAWMHCKSG